MIDPSCTPRLARSEKLHFDITLIVLVLVFSLFRWRQPLEAVMKRILKDLRCLNMTRGPGKQDKKGTNRQDYQGTEPQVRDGCLGVIASRKKGGKHTGGR